MKLSLLFAFGLILCLFNHGLYSQSGIVDKSTGEVFPRAVGFGYDGKNYQLEATGVATRKKLIVKVYSIAHYLQKGVSGKDIQNILSDDYAKQFTIKWVHDVSLDKIQTAFEESFHRVFNAEQYSKMQNDIDSFLKLFTQPVVKGDQYVLRWLPGGRIEVIINSQEVGSVTGKEFAKGVWEIWFGPKSIVDVNDLLGKT